MSRWLDQAHRYIAMLNVPADADLKACRKLFREKGSHFHGGTYWGRKQWGKAVRQFLIGRGLMERPKTPLPLMPADIVFPFRESTSGIAARSDETALAGSAVGKSPALRQQGDAQTPPRNPQ